MDKPAVGRNPCTPSPPSCGSKAAVVKQSTRLQKHCPWPYWAARKRNCDCSRWWFGIFFADPAHERCAANYPAVRKYMVQNPTHFPLAGGGLGRVDWRTLLFYSVALSCTVGQRS